MKKHISDKIFKQLSVLLMMMLIITVFFSSTGIYYTRHYCHGNPTGIKIFNSIEVTGKCSCKAEAFDVHGCLTSVAADNCCVEFDHYLKSDIQSEKNAAPRIHLILPFMEIQPEPPVPIIGSLNHEIKYYNKPPPFSQSGKDIVIFNRSLRIPLI